ncbi:MAG: DUF4931 domain-containing protein [Bacillota bacterium]
MEAELRHDPFSGTWAGVAAGRARRPVEAKGGGECPFCPGNEDLTPPELASWRDETGEHWLVRVVDNLFPALLPGARGPSAGPQKEELYHAVPAVGAHEVIVEHPDHHATWASMAERHLTLVLQAWQARYRHHARDPSVRYVQLFRNSGPASGASLSHPHSQLVALPLVPLSPEAELSRAAAYSSATGRCPYCDVVAREAGGPRLVLANGDFVAFCPFASRVPYETWVVPRRHEPDFGNLTPPELALLARVLQALAACHFGTPGGTSFNLILHSAPCDGGSYPHYHCHLEWIPRTGTAGGFEWGTGWFINPVPPEAAARHLRSNLGAR